MNPQQASNSAKDIVFSRKSGWIPNVIRKNGYLYLELGAAADANHEPRTFAFPITDAHLEVIKQSLTRHLLLWAAVLPICEAAGTSDPFSDEAAMALLDPILFGNEDEVESLFKENNWNTQFLIGHHADTPLLEQGKLFEALRNGTATSDQTLMAEYAANVERARRGVILAPVDEAILHYTGQYLYRSGIPSHKPDAVDPTLLPEVLAIISTAEEATTGMELSPNRYDEKGRYQIDKQEWNAIGDTVKVTLRTMYPTLANDAIESISHLLCSDAFKRAKKASN